MKKQTSFVLFVLILAVAFSSSVFAASYRFSNQYKPVRVGNLLLKYQYLSGVPSPYTFYMMDQRFDLKPAGWKLINPIAEAGYQNTNPAYWYVYITDPLNDLTRFDTLLVQLACGGTVIGPPGDNVNGAEFTALGSENLRKFVDGGGVLWIEQATNTTISPDTVKVVLSDFFITDVEFVRTGVAGPSIPLPSHALVSRPFRLTWDDLSEAVESGWRVSGSTGVPNPDYFVTVLSDSGGNPVISAARYGSGYIVLSAAAISHEVSVPYENALAYIAANPLLTQDEIQQVLDIGVSLAENEDLKLAFNILSWPSEQATFHKNDRHSGYSFAEIGAPLETLWEHPDASGIAPSSSPAIMDGMVYYVDGANVLRAFDVSPYRDRDLDGFADDGVIVDLSTGTEYDEVWETDLGQAASSVTADYIYSNASGFLVPAVFVVTADGDLSVFDAETGAGVPVTITATVNSFPVGASIPAPVHMDGTIYWGDGTGNLHGLDLIGNQDWVWPLTPGATGPASSVTCGYVQDPISGGVDLVAYYTKECRQGSGTEAVMPFPVKVRGEMLTTNARVGAVIQTRSAPNEVKAGWKIYYIVPSSEDWVALQSYSPGDIVSYDGTGYVCINAVSGSTPPPLDMVSWSSGDLSSYMVYMGDGKFQTGAIPTWAQGGALLADYDIDMMDIVTGINYRTRIAVKAGSSPNHYAVKSPALQLSDVGVEGSTALGVDDSLFFATTNGSLYSARETGRRVTRPLINWRFYLGDPAPNTWFGADSYFTGSPVASRDTVFATVNNSNNGYILGFDADPSFVFYTGVPIASNSTVQILQFDGMNPSSAPRPITGIAESSADPTVMDTVPFVVDYTTGKITLNNFRSSNNTDTDLSSSQNIVVRFAPGGLSTSGLQEERTFTAFGSGGFSNLKWYVPLSARITSSAVVMGKYLYVGLEDGSLLMVDTEQAETIGTKYKNSTGVPIADPTEPTNPIFVRSVNPAPGVAMNATVAGSSGMLAVSSGAGLAVMYNPITLAVEGDRLVELDTAGNEVWACDGTVGYSRATTGNPTVPVYEKVTVPFNRPSVARKVSSSDIVVADTGNNRMVRVDSGGNIQWLISDFADTGKPTDLNYPNAYLLAAGDPLSLNRPTDVSMWVQWWGGRPEYHYLIADSGNFRVLEVVSRWSAVTGDYRNELDWASKSIAEGKRYRYVFARRTNDIDPVSKAVSEMTVCVATDLGGEASGSKLVFLDSDGNVSKLADCLDETNNVYSLKRDTDPAARIDLNNPIFFDRKFVNATDCWDVVVDAYGIHVFGWANGVFAEQRNFTAADYAALYPGRRLSACYAQFMPNSNDILVSSRSVNVGINSTGEVFLLVWDSINSKYDLQPLAGLRQPSSAERFFE